MSPRECRRALPFFYQKKIINILNIQKKMYFCRLFEVKCFEVGSKGWKSAQLLDFTDCN